MVANKKVQIFQSKSLSIDKTISQLSAHIPFGNIGGILFFCSSNYDLTKLNNAIHLKFKCMIAGCTTAGEIYKGYSNNSFVALVFNASYFTMHSHVITNMKNFTISNALKIANNIENELIFTPSITINKSIGFLLLDGLSLAEEKIAALMYQAMGGVNILGGSVADDYKMDKTSVFCNQKVYANSAVFIFLEIQDTFGIFRIQHFEPTNKELITTNVEHEKRIVNEMNGEAAAEVYAKINNLDPNHLSSLDFAMYPLMIQISDEWYIRSISHVSRNKGLQFHCSIDNGLPLRIGKGKDLVQRIEEEVKQIFDCFEEIYFTIGCDCILRRLEMEDKGHTKKVEKLLTSIKFIGFNSYGEQYNGIHFNQTMVGVTVGKKRHL